MENNIESKLKILVVEDEKQHRQEAEEFFRTVHGCEIDFMEDYHEACIAMSQTDYAGVIIDIYMPKETNVIVRGERRNVGDGLPWGVNVAAECYANGIPFVFCTSGYHHGEKYELVNTFQQIMNRKHKEWQPMIDCGNTTAVIGEGNEVEAKHKEWKKAYETLACMINAKNCQYNQTNGEELHEKDTRTNN